MEEKEFDTAFARLPDGYSGALTKPGASALQSAAPKMADVTAFLPESWLEPISLASTCTASQRARLHSSRVRCPQKRSWRSCSTFDRTHELGFTAKRGDRDGREPRPLGSFLVA
jgi:hypothetical protein